MSSQKGSIMFLEITHHEANIVNGGSVRGVVVIVGGALIVAIMQTGMSRFSRLRRDDFYDKRIG